MRQFQRFAHRSPYEIVSATSCSSVCGRILAASSFDGLMSYPEQNDGPAPRITITRTSLPRSAACTASMSSSCSNGDSALRFSGRLSVMRSTSPMRSVRIVSYPWVASMLKAYHCARADAA